MLTYHNGKPWGAILGTGFVLAVVGGLAAFSYHVQTNLEAVTLEITGKERITSVSGSDGSTSTTIKNYVYTDDEVYVVKDSFWNWHFRALTVWAKLPDGPATCDVTLSGYRWGYLSMSRNIIAADCVEG